MRDPFCVGFGLIGKAAVDIVCYSEADGSIPMRVVTTEPGIQVLSEPYYSVRKAWINGRETHLLCADAGFIGVALPAFLHDFYPSYESASLYIGGAITEFSMIVAVAALV